MENKKSYEYFKSLSVLEMENQGLFRVSLNVFRRSKWIDKIDVTFTELFNCGYDLDKYEFSLAKYGDINPYKKIVGEHFGVKPSGMGGLEISEGIEANRYLRHMIIDQQKEYSLRNATFYSLMKYWARHMEWSESCKNNNAEELNDKIEMLKEIGIAHFQEIFDLNEVKGVSGVYIMVLDKYNVCYVGQAADMKRRIMRHWSTDDYFWGKGIDRFKAYDTTRIFVEKTDNFVQKNSSERLCLCIIPPEYTLNVLAGGTGEFLEGSELSPFRPVDNFDAWLQERIKQEEKRDREIWKQRKYFLVP